MRTLAEGIFCLVKPMNFLFFFFRWKNESVCVQAEECDFGQVIGMNTAYNYRI